MVLLEVVRKGLDGNQGNGIAVGLEIVVVSLEIGAVANGWKIILFDFLICASILLKKNIEDSLYIFQLTLSEVCNTISEDDTSVVNFNAIFYTNIHTPSVVKILIDRSPHLVAPVRVVPCVVFSIVRLRTLCVQ